MSKATRAFATILALGHIALISFWCFATNFFELQSCDNPEPFCYHQIPNCDLVRQNLPEFFWPLLMFTSFFISLVTIIFVMRNWQSDKVWYPLIGVSIVLALTLVSNPAIIGFEPHSLANETTICRPLLTGTRGSDTIQLSSPFASEIIENSCDLNIYESQIRQLCRQNASRQEIDSLNFSLFQNNPDNNKWYKVIDRPRLCSQPFLKTALFKTLQTPVSVLRKLSSSGLSDSAEINSIDLFNEVTNKVTHFNSALVKGLKGSPVTDSTGVYVTNDSGWLIKFDEMGEVLWRFYTGELINPMRSTPALDDKKVYLTNPEGFTSALDKMTGQLIWSRINSDNSGSHPTLANGYLYLTQNYLNDTNRIEKVDVNTGEGIWLSDSFKGFVSGGVAFDEASNTVLYGNSSGELVALNAEDGSTVWQKQLKGPIRSTPTIWNGIAIITSYDEHLRAYDPASGEEKWHTFMGGKLRTQLAIHPKKPLGFTNTKRGELVSVDLNTGELKWGLRHGDDHHKANALVVKSNDKKNPYVVWARCRGANLCAINADSGKMIKKITLPGYFSNTPALFKNKLFISLDDESGFVTIQ